MGVVQMIRHEAARVAEEQSRRLARAAWRTRRRRAALITTLGGVVALALIAC